VSGSDEEVEPVAAEERAGADGAAEGVADTGGGADRAVEGTDGAAAGTGGATDVADPWLGLDEPDASPGRVDALARERLGRFAVDDVRRSAGLTSWLVRRAAADGSTTVDGTVWAAALRGYGIHRPRPGLDAAVAAGRVVALPAERVLVHPRWGPLEGRIAEGLRRLLDRGGPAAGGSGGDGAAGGGAAAGVAAAEAEAAGPEASAAGDAENANASGGDDAGAGAAGAASDPIDSVLAARIAVVVAGRDTATDDWLGRLQERADAAGRSLTIVDEAHRLDLTSAAEMLVRHENSAADHLVLVGDPDELEPAAPGRFLGDLVDSGSIPAIRLPVDPDGGPIARLVESLRAGELPPVEAGQHDVVVSPVADADQAIARVVELVTDALPRVLGVGPSDLVALGIRRSGTVGVDALREAVGSGCDVATIDDAVGRRAEAVVLVLPAESAGSLTRAHLISAASVARRQLSIVHQAGPALAAAVRLRSHRPRRTRLAELLRT
jgi:hypothetical protein